MNIVAKIFNCNWNTYKKYYKDAIRRAYLKDGINIDANDIKVEIDELSGSTIQSMRSPSGRHTRTISVFENDKIKYIIAFSNTNYDEDKRLEGGKYVYGGNDYHANTYMVQGITKIFKLYYDLKQNNPKLQLFFYLLDVDQNRSYVDNAYNDVVYRELATLGFEILNLDLITFKDLKQLGFSLDESGGDIKYTSFIKFVNDKAAVSDRKAANNMPSYLRIINNDFDIENGDRWEQKTSHTKYIYMFKALGANAYDSFLTMWTLYELASEERKNLEFAFVSEKWNFRLGQPDEKMTSDFPRTIIDLFAQIGLDIHYESSDEIRQQLEREEDQYSRAKKNDDVRNQELFRNNLRAKGVVMRCPLCGCEMEDILEAAHIWSVSDIRGASYEKIEEVLSMVDEADIVDITNPHHDDLFYKKYSIANSGDNGVWLCSNHHGLFDSNCYCFDTEYGKILMVREISESNMEFFREITKNDRLPSEILNKNTKVFINERKRSLFLK